MTYTALTYSFPNLEPVCCSVTDRTVTELLQNCYRTVCNCCFLTYIQSSQEAGKVIWHSQLLKIFLQCVVIHTVKGFWVVHEAEVDVFLKPSFFFNDPMDVDTLISSSSAFSKSSLNIWKFLVYVMLSLAWRILSIILLAYEMNAIVH